MEAKGRFGLLIPEINSPLDRDLVEGAFAQARQLGYDLIVYTGIYNCQREFRYDSYIAGLENIYTLICTQKLDGIIFAEERFHTRDVIEKVSSCLMQTDTPCLVLGGSSNRANTMNADEYGSMYRITRHMTDEHGCRKIYCLAGVPGHKSSEERLRGFRDACRDSGVSVNDSDIFYGWFWKDVPRQLGQDIAEGKLERPEAVVCCNDVMAAALIESLADNGINVPGDVKVTGFDGGLDSIICQPSVTTIAGRDKQFGADAVCRLYAMIAGVMPKQELFSQSIRFGRSCGCCRESALDPHILDMIRMNREKRTFIATDFIHHMNEAASAEELSAHIDEVGHIFRGVEWLDICLCSDWLGDPDNPDDYRQYGYPDEMYLLLSKRRGGNENAFYSFRTSDILPALSEAHSPHLIVITSLHCGGQIFGYAAAAYSDTVYIAADEYYVSWCDSVSNGVKSLQKRMLEQHFSRQLEKLSETDPVTGICNRRGFMLRAPEMINQYSSENRKSYLLLITYFPEKTGAVEPGQAIEGILTELCMNRLCARMSENIYAVVIPSQDEGGIINTSENLVAAVESGLRDRYGDVRIPEFITDTSVLDTAEKNGIEKVVREAIQSLSDRKKAAESYITDYKDLIYRLRRNIVSQPQKDWEMESISREIGISKSHLQRLYKQMFSTSIKDDVINSRIKRAMQLLEHTDMRVADIAEQCGYNNENHFMRQFKEKSSRTAAQFRKEKRALQLR